MGHLFILYSIRLSVGFPPLSSRTDKNALLPPLQMSVLHTIGAPNHKVNHGIVRSGKRHP
jgi:hypothetical protein